MEVLSQKPLFSTDPCTKGFDLSAGKIWIYPENYPLREYQFTIVQAALYHNTLVCLPTGLGKTFIAAVVMYNFWRWYPQGKIVFLAPTKPLVAQQINACHDIMGIPSDETIELTGATDQKRRRTAWLKKRVIFATPQVFHKDLEKDIVPTELVKCIVVDEAHRALGKHSYCECIRLLTEKNEYFRVVGLSATPGGKLDAVQKVIGNLHIEHLELRDDMSPDITPYINERKLDIVLVGLGQDLECFKESYIKIMDRHVRILVDNNIIQGCTGNIGKGRIFHLQKEWHKKPNKPRNQGQISKTLSILMTMYHAYELMIRHGLRAFYNFYHKHEDKFWLNDEPQLKELLENINCFLGPFPDLQPLPDGSIPEINETIKFGHNKFYKLKDILLRHFEAFEGKEEKTRAIVFVEFRDIVNEVYALLLQAEPLLRPQKFVGQAGQTQKQQKQALQNFRDNKCNVLISTSVGEEGLDVGEVDLIVCFDISQQSPIRLVQRMGRTGRKRAGHIIALVTDGKEHQTLKSTMARRDSLNIKVLHSSGIIEALYKQSPRMVPVEFQPECMKMHMQSLPKTVEPVKSKGKEKEPKKSRKRADASNKTKTSKIPEPSNAGSQSSLLKFFKKSRDDADVEVNTDFVCPAVNDLHPLIKQYSQTFTKRKNVVKSSNIKLLTSDSAAVEFLTLCAIKKSEKEETNFDCTLTTANPYLPSYHRRKDEIDIFFNFKTPALEILDCIKNLTEYVEPIGKNENCDEIFSDNDDRISPIRDFNVCNDWDEFSEYNEDADDKWKFETLLDDSSNDDDTKALPPAETKHDDFPVEEKVDWDENVEGLDFEDSFDEWPGNSRMSMNKDECTEVTASNQTNHGATTNSPVKFKPFEEILDVDSSNSIDEKEISEKNVIKTPVDGTTSSPVRSRFESLLDEDSSTTADEEEIYRRTELRREREENAQIKLDVAMEVSNSSWNGDDTRFNTTHNPRRTENIKVPAEQSEIIVLSDDSIETLLIPDEEVVPRRRRRSLDEEVVPRKVFKIDEESVDSLKDHDLNTSRFFSTETKTKSFKNASRVENVSKSSSFANFYANHSSTLSLPRAIGESDGLSTRTNTSDSDFVNIERQGQNDRLISDVQVDSWKSRLGSVTSSREAPAKDRVEEQVDSEEDMFGINDLLVDSDLDEEIKTLEKSAENVNTSDKKESPQPKSANVDVSDTFGHDRSRNTVKSGSSLFDIKAIEEKCRKITQREITKYSTNSPNKSLRSECNQNTYQFKSDVTNHKSSPVKLSMTKIPERGSEEAKIEKSSPGKAYDLKLNYGTSAWNTEVSQLNSSNTSSASTGKDNCNLTNEVAGAVNSSPTKTFVSDFNLDDCDWDSDFETPFKASKPTTSPWKIQTRESTKTPLTSSTTSWHETANSSRVEKTTGWLTTQDSKPRPSLSSKLSRNLRNARFKEQLRKRSPPKTDSDSENDFVVYRVENNVENATTRNIFANKLSPLSQTEMDDFKRTTRVPLSSIRNDLNKMDRSDLKKFVAPEKYTQRSNREASNQRTVGCGKQKSVSVNFDTRKRKRVSLHPVRKKAREVNEFIDGEAEVSDAEDYTSGSSGADDDLDGFVSHSQTVDEPDDMHAHYLQTVRSPFRSGGFLIKKAKSPMTNAQIYSQPILNESDAYVHDSFCVAHGDEISIDSASTSEISELEELERKLKSRKRKRLQAKETRAKKMRKVLAPISDATSSEDEMEILRRQIEDESR